MLDLFYFLYKDVRDLIRQIRFSQKLLSSEIMQTF